MRSAETNPDTTGLTADGLRCAFVFNRSLRVSVGVKLNSAPSRAYPENSISATPSALLADDRTPKPRDASSIAKRCTLVLPAVTGCIIR